MSRARRFSLSIAVACAALLSLPDLGRSAPKEPLDLRGTSWSLVGKFLTKAKGFKAKDDIQFRLDVVNDNDISMRDALEGEEDLDADYIPTGKRLNKLLGALAFTSEAELAQLLETELAADGILTDASVAESSLVFKVNGSATKSKLTMKIVYSVLFTQFDQVVVFKQKFKMKGGPI
ncbi:MAG: hypothetical protein ACYTDX_08535 [Planctomycetota bacterium]|jgi:hypothetical protein